MVDFASYPFVLRPGTFPPLLPPKTPLDVLAAVETVPRRISQSKGSAFNGPGWAIWVSVIP